MLTKPLSIIHYYKEVIQSQENTLYIHISIKYVYFIKQALSDSISYTCIYDQEKYKMGYNVFKIISCFLVTIFSFYHAQGKLILKLNGCQIFNAFVLMVIFQFHLSQWQDKHIYFIKLKCFFCTHLKRDKEYFCQVQCYKVNMPFQNNYF